MAEPNLAVATFGHSIRLLCPGLNKPPTSRVHSPSVRLLSGENILGYRPDCLSPGFMHDMSGVNLADQLMASSGEPTDLGWYIINGNY